MSTTVTKYEQKEKELARHPVFATCMALLKCGRCRKGNKTRIAKKSAVFGR